MNKWVKMSVVWKIDIFNEWVWFSELTNGNGCDIINYY